MEDELAEPHTYIFLCAKDQKQLQVTLYLENGDVKQITEPEAVTADNAALYDTGKQIQTNSLSVAISFCTAMITVSTGSVAFTPLF